MAANFALRFALACGVISGVASYFLNPHLILYRWTSRKASCNLRLEERLNFDNIGSADTRKANLVVRMAHQNSNPVHKGLKKLCNQALHWRWKYLSPSGLDCQHGKLLRTCYVLSCSSARSFSSLGSARCSMQDHHDEGGKMQAEKGIASISSPSPIRPAPRPHQRRAMLAAAAAAAVAAAANALPASASPAGPSAPGTLPAVPAPGALSEPPRDGSVEIPLQKCGPAYCVTYRCPPARRGAARVPPSRRQRRCRRRRRPGAHDPACPACLP